MQMQKKIKPLYSVAIYENLGSFKAGLSYTALTSGEKSYVCLKF